MTGYSAVFLKEEGEHARRLHVQDLGATTIQGAIDEAQGCAATHPDASLIEIFHDGAKVESVGTGEAYYRT